MLEVRTHRIACIPGDGIGIDVTEQAIRVLKKLESQIKSFSLQFGHFDWSSERYKTLGSYMPPDGLDQLKKYDAILFGAVGSSGKFSSSREKLVLNPLSANPLSKEKYCNKSIVIVESRCS